MSDAGMRWILWVGLALSGVSTVAQFVLLLAFRRVWAKLREDIAILSNRGRQLPQSPRTTIEDIRRQLRSTAEKARALQSSARRVIDSIHELLQYASERLHRIGSHRDADGRLRWKIRSSEDRESSQPL